MIPEIRANFNANYTDSKFKELLEFIESKYPKELEFRVAETPVFFDTTLSRKLIEASEKIVDAILAPDFKSQSKSAIPSQCYVPGNEGRPHFMAFDFGICKDEAGMMVPQLIELQGFPTLFGFQEFLGRAYESVFDIPENFTMYFNGHTHDSYLSLLKRVIIGENNVENVVLMDIKPAIQKTRIDFKIMEDYLGIPIVDFFEIRAEGKKLY